MLEVWVFLAVLQFNFCGTKNGLNRRLGDKIVKDAWCISNPDGVTCLEREGGFKTRWTEKVGVFAVLREVKSFYWDQLINEDPVNA